MPRGPLLPLLLALGCTKANAVDSSPPDSAPTVSEEGCSGSVSEDTSAAGAQIFAVGGAALTATFHGGTAGYSSTLRLVAPSEVFIGELHNTALGTEVPLGSFEEGEELVFSIEVAETGQTWTSGPAERNYDYLPHARVVQAGEASWYAGFEDLEYVGDSDYNDVCFSISGELILQPPAQ